MTYRSVFSALKYFLLWPQRDHRLPVHCSPFWLFLPVSVRRAQLLLFAARPFLFSSHFEAISLIPWHPGSCTRTVSTPLSLVLICLGLPIDPTKCVTYILKNLSNQCIGNRSSTPKVLLPQRSGPGEHPTQAQLQAGPSHPAPPPGAPSSPCTLPTPGCCVHHSHPPAGSQPTLLPTSSLACETRLPQRCHSEFQNQASPSMSHSLVRAFPWLTDRKSVV